jgi:hypothetical protein
MLKKNPNLKQNKHSFMRLAAIDKMPQNRQYIFDTGINKEIDKYVTKSTSLDGKPSNSQLYEGTTQPQIPRSKHVRMVKIPANLRNRIPQK